MDCFASLTVWRLSIRIGALELAQQVVAALDGEVERRLRGVLAAEHLLQLVVDHAADQHKGPKPDSLRILGRRLQGQLLYADRRAGIAVVEALRGDRHRATDPEAADREFE